jgi:hypothetical protein
MQSGTFTVDSIKSRHDYKNYYHNHFYLKNHAITNSATLEIIEGVGSIVHPLFLYCSFYPPFGVFGNANCIATTFNEFLSCKWDNGKKVYFDSCAYTTSYSSSCFAYTDSCNYYNNCGGIEQYTNSEHVIIAPNPSNGNFTIELSSSAKQTMQVYDVNGKLVLSQPISGKTTIDASSLNEGVYNITITNSIGITNKKLVIVR